MIFNRKGKKDQKDEMPDNDNFCCGTCRYGSYDKTNGYVCVNDKSDYVADFVEYDNVCEEWEGKKR